MSDWLYSWRGATIFAAVAVGYAMWSAAVFGWFGTLFGFTVVVYNLGRVMRAMDQ